MNNFRKSFEQYVNESEKIIVSGHISPDGDSMGSSMAMALALKNQGKEVYLLLENYSEKYNILRGKELIYTGDLFLLKGDLFISLDCGSKERLGYFSEIFDRTPRTINIDHHMGNTEFAELNYVDDKASSTSEVVFNLLNSYLPITDEIATNIYAGIIYDTGGFRHSSTSIATHKIISEVLKFDVPFSEVYNEIFYMHSYAETRLLGCAINNLKLLKNKKVAYTTITLKEIQSCDATSKDLDGIVEYINNIKNTEIVFIAYEKSLEETKISFRSREADVHSIAKKFGGGGHKNAAGCIYAGPIEEAVEDVMAEVSIAIES